MSRENVEIVMAAYRAIQEEDYVSPFALVTEDIVWDMTGFGLPDLARVYHGHAGIRTFWTSWLSAWERIEFVSLVPEDHGDHVVVEVAQRARGRASGVEVDFHYWQAYTVRGGRITASHMAQTRDAALAAVGR